MIYQVLAADISGKSYIYQEGNAVWNIQDTDITAKRTWIKNAGSMDKAK